MKIEIAIFVALILSVAGAAGAIAVKEVKKRGAVSLIVLVVSMMVWSLAYWEPVSSWLSSMGRSLTVFMQLWMLVAGSAQFAFSRACTRPFSSNSKLLLYLSIMPLLAFIRFGIETWLHFSLTSVAWLIFAEAWDNIVSIYVLLLSGLSMFLLWITFFEIPSLYRGRILVISVAFSFPFIGQLLDIQEFNILPFIFSLPAYALSAIGFEYELINQGFSEVASFTRKHILDAIMDGLVVINRQNVIVDINSTFEEIVGRPRKLAIGKPIIEVLGNLPSLGKPINESHEFERKRYLGSPEEWQYLTVRMSPLMSQNNEAVGRIIVWSDSTKRKRVDEARQKAREEMFVLINAISSGAREAATLEEFLTETIYQIVYPFHSQVVIIFLEDERKREGQEKYYYLASHFGVPPDLLNSILNIPASSELFGHAMIDQQPFLIENAAQDPHIPVELYPVGLACLLVVPLITRINDENRFLGYMCLGRKENPVYSSDEIIRLTAICDHLASLIDNDRRRKLAIALSERKGLMRDLHDSVSQKLYGLVALTEAAQAALEAGNTIDPSQVLLRIGENARQAVREMRLFLYQMQPVDLEKDGLVSAIHHRLAAVEGRGDIKARMLADEHIALSKEKEIALYFIAQEALNNILRHASAKTVTVKLKQGPRNVILEIIDDGCGFDPKKLDRAGLGLVNMKERTLKINGKMKIVSKPGQGSRISITVPRDLFMRQKSKLTK